MIYVHIVTNNKKPSKPRGLYILGGGIAPTYYRMSYDESLGRIGGVLRLYRDCLKFLSKEFKGKKILIVFNRESTVYDWLFGGGIPPLKYAGDFDSCMNALSEFGEVQYKVSEFHTVNIKDYKVAEARKPKKHLVYEALDF